MLKTTFQFWNFNISILKCLRKTHSICNTRETTFQPWDINILILKGWNLKVEMLKTKPQPWNSNISLLKCWNLKVRNVENISTLKFRHLNLEMLKAQGWNVENNMKQKSVCNTWGTNLFVTHEEKIYLYHKRKTKSICNTRGNKNYV